MSPGLAGEEAGKDEAIAYLAYTTDSAAGEFIGAGLVVGEDIACKKGTIHDC